MIPTIINGVVTVSDNDTLRKMCKRKCNRVEKLDPRSNNSVSKNVHKVFVLGDSHLRRCVLDLKSELPAKYKVSGVIKPGAKAEEIVKTAINEICNLGIHDIVILSAGSSDVDRKNLGVVLTQINAFVQTNYGTNIIIFDLPYRHDLNPTSSGNMKIREFNRKLRKITAVYKQVFPMSTNFSRGLFTRHRLHWNKWGKAQAVKLLCQIIKIIFQEVPQPMTNLKWIESATLGDKLLAVNQEREDLDKHQQLVIEKSIARRISTRQKRLPVTRMNDFLW
jgi:hypothetical protein